MDQATGRPASPTSPQPVYRPPHPGPSGRAPSHRRPAGRSRLAAAAGIAAVLGLLGAAVAAGVIPSPLTAGRGTPSAAGRASAADAVAGALLRDSASPLGTYALARMPAPAKKAKTPASSPPAPAAGGPAPQATAKYQTPAGENQKVWSEAILTALGAPLTSANIVSIGYWMQNEAGSPPYGIVGANNPINVSQPCCGGVPIQSDGDGVTFLQSYPTAADGVEATAQYLSRDNYTAIIAALKSGAGLMNNASLAAEIQLYSGGGYSTIPDSWGASQGTPLS
jgi:hypothetical protein